MCRFFVKIWSSGAWRKTYWIFEANVRSWDLFNRWQRIGRNMPTFIWGLDGQAKLARSWHRIASFKPPVISLPIHTVQSLFFLKWMSKNSPKAWNSDCKWGSMSKSTPLMELPSSNEFIDSFVCRLTAYQSAIGILVGFLDPPWVSIF